MQSQQPTNIAMECKATYWVLSEDVCNSYGQMVGVPMKLEVTISRDKSITETRSSSFILMLPKY